MKKRLLQIISTITLALVLFVMPCMATVLDSNVTKEMAQQTRTISATEDLVDCESVFNAYEDLTLEIEDSITTFEGVQSINLSDLMDIDEVSAEDLEELSEKISIRYKYSYDYETNCVSLEALSINNGEESVIDTIYGEAFINEAGNIDAYLEIEDEIILLSELQDAGMVQNCGWFSKMIKKAICRTVVAVAAVTIIAATCGAGLGATILIGAAVGATVGAGTGAHESYKATGEVQAGAVFAGMGVGAAAGAVTGAAVGLAKKGIAKVASMLKSKSKISSMIKAVDANKKNHILQAKHGWNQIGNGKWSSVKKAITHTLNKGTVSAYKESTQLVTAVYKGKTVQVHIRLVDGIMKIVNAWVVI